MLTGEVPPVGNRADLKKLPKKMGNVIRKCMHHNPGQRYGSMKELSDVLQKISLKHINFFVGEVESAPILLN